MSEITLKLQRKMGRGCERFLSRDEVKQLHRQGVRANRNEDWQLCTNDEGVYSLRYATKKSTFTWAVEAL
jgi:hypothetical protein